MLGSSSAPNSNFNFGFLRYNSDPKPKKKLISYHIHNFTHIDYDWQGRMYIWETENLVELSLAAQQLCWVFGMSRLMSVCLITSLARRAKPGRVIRSAARTPLHFLWR